MRRGLAIIAYVLAVPLVGWPLLFCILLAYKVNTDGLAILEVVELRFWVRAAAAGVFGLVLWGVGGTLASPGRAADEQSRARR